MENQTMLFDVVVVGCGLSGLTAAYEALKIDPSIQICLLEAKDRVGGRTLTSDVELGDGRKEKFDLGGQWVARSQPDIMEILEELGLETYPQFITGEKVMQVGRGNNIRRYKSDIPSIGSFWGLIELQLFIWKAERLAKKIPMEDPYKWPSAQKYDSMTFSSFVDANLRNQGARDTIQAACRATMGTDLERISALFFLAYANSAGGIMKLLMATENGAQELRVKGGTQQISELLSDKIGRGRIHLNEAVESVDQTENFAVVKTSTGHTYRAKTVIVSIPPHCASDVKFIPPLPEHRKLLIDNMPVGHLTKFIVTYDKAYWRDARMSGEIVSNGGDPVLGCSSGPISVVYDATTNNDVPALVGFIAGRAGAEWHHKTAAERRSGVLNGLSDCLGSWALKPTSYAEKIWAEESYNGGCPVSFGVPGVMFAFHALRKPHGRVHWCGTETATHWAGYLSGAVQSGRRAACEVMRVRGHDVVKLERLVNREPYDFQSPPYAVSNVLTPVVTVLAVVLACVAVFYI